MLLTTGLQLDYPHKTSETPHPKKALTTLLKCSNQNTQTRQPHLSLSSARARAHTHTHTHSAVSRHEAQIWQQSNECSDSCKLPWVGENKFPKILSTSMITILLTMMTSSFTQSIFSYVLLADGHPKHLKAFGEQARRTANFWAVFHVQKLTAVKHVKGFTSFLNIFPQFQENLIPTNCSFKSATF